jgi:small nuclear ribonucleoprotein (snRNP)-like protein
MKKLLVVAAGFLLITILILVGLDFLTSKSKSSLVVTESTLEKKIIPSPTPKVASQDSSTYTPIPGSTLDVTPSTEVANSITGEPKDSIGYPVQIRLRDGTTLTGDVLSDKLKVQSPYGDLALDMKSILSVVENKVKMYDGTIFSGDFLTKTLKVKTKHGDLDVDIEKVASLDVYAGNTITQKAEDLTDQEQATSLSGKEKKFPPPPSQPSEQQEKNVTSDTPEKNLLSKQQEKKSSTDVLEKTSSPKQQDKDPLRGIVNIKTGVLNVRANKGNNARVVTTLKKGEKVEILESFDEWHKVKLADGRFGYVSARYLKIEE